MPTITLMSRIFQKTVRYESSFNFVKLSKCSEIWEIKVTMNQQLHVTEISGNLIMILEEI